MVNTKHDATSYENCCQTRDIYDGNLLYESFLKAKKGSDWKPQVQRFEINYLSELANLQKVLQKEKYEFLPSTEFTLNERGKIRHITGENIRDRVAKHALCDEILTPSISKYLIYDNGASQKGKGIDFTRRRLVCHLQKYYRQNKTNEGYILLIDFSKYYDNIQHGILLNQFSQYFHDEKAFSFLQDIISQSRIDVSYLNDEEFQLAQTSLFNSLEYEKINKELKTGEKYLNKHLNIGDQVAQVAGVMYPIPIDNYIKIVKGIKFYGRYMDDSYIIHSDKEYLKQLLKEIIEVANKLGIIVNTRKTRICKLSSYWRFLQIQYSLTNTGRIIRKINPKRLTGMRRKLKKICLYIPETDFDNLYKAWINNYYKIMSKQQIFNMETLYHTLKEEYKYVQDNPSERYCS